MRRAHFIILSLIAAAGCNGGNRYKAENPVMPNAPPRRMAMRGVDATASDESAIAPVASWDDNATAAQELSGSQVAATVNSRPIFVSDVLDRYQARLDTARGQMSPAEYRRLRLALLERDLPKMIENRLLVDALKSTLKPEQIEQMQTQLDRMFQLQVEQWKAKFGVGTLHEVEIELAREGASLHALKEEFANQTMAREYLKAKSNLKTDVSREELIAEYKTRLDSFAHPARVRWQELEIEFSEHGGRRGATEVLTEAVNALRNSVPFSEVAQRYSDGPTASQGGVRDWVDEGSLADSELEQTLFELPIGGVSQIFDKNGRFQIVRVLERQAAHYTPFEEVQDQLEQEILEREREQAFETVLSDLKKDALIITMFDEPERVSAAQPLPLR